eukprot:TRINITY_DN6240_c1_g1_i1.p1 TRINITY_DN6240_c1_g1~~TRINITY_DN6240_c1_g1_i1.p1  ORF type:complete len:1138 (+),score=155.05 TRINITY_DN6240_c1_g1_i1:286-3414(+)
MAHCLWSTSAAAIARHSASPISRPCSLELDGFIAKVARQSVGSDQGVPVIMVEYVPGFRKSCAVYVERFCGNSRSPLKCVLQHTTELGFDCKREAREAARLMAANLFHDHALFANCEPDLKRIVACRFHEPLLTSSGKRLACLKAHRFELSRVCRDALFQRERDDSVDLRLNVEVRRICATEISSHCSLVEFGDARMQKCVWENRFKPGFSLSCRNAIEKHVQRTVEDYRLDYRIFNRCNETIGKLCSQEVAVMDQATNRSQVHGKVMHCLKQHFTEIKDIACKNEVQRVVGIHSVHAGEQADPVFSRSCGEDVRRYCPMVTKSKRHECLRAHMLDLSSNCQHYESLQGSIEARSIHNKPEMQRKCVKDVSKFCSDVPTGAGEVITCLRDTMLRGSASGGLSADCHEAVRSDLVASNNDWRLKYGLSTHCKLDAKRLCYVEMKWAVGGVFSCLSRQIDKVDSRRCRDSVKSQLRQELVDIRFSSTTNRACVGDVKEFCGSIEPGSGAVHACLLRFKSSLSQACAQAEFALQKARSSDMSLDIVAIRACRTSIAALCKDVTPGSGELWGCLEANRHKPEMRGNCRAVVEERIVLKNHHFFLSPQLSKSCLEETRKLCPTELEVAKRRDFVSADGVIRCLIEHRHDIRSSQCSYDLARKRRQRLESLRSGTISFQDCAHDAKVLCPAELNSTEFGILRKCLRKKRDELSARCTVVEDMAMQMESEDIQLNPSMEAACATSRQIFCDGRSSDKVIGCLLENLHANDMAQGCAKHLEREVKKRGEAMRFNLPLIDACKADMSRMHAMSVCANVTLDARLLCLTARETDVVDEACIEEINAFHRLQSNDARARPHMMKDCEADIKAFCAGVKPGRGGLHLCLRRNIGNLTSQECKEHVRNVQKVELGHANINPEVRRQCSNERKLFCHGIESGRQRVLICLHRNKDSEGFSVECKMALKQVPVSKAFLKGQKDLDESRVQAAVNKAVGDLTVFVKTQALGVADLTGTTMAGGIIGTMVCFSMCLLFFTLMCRRCRGKYERIGKPERA